MTTGNLKAFVLHKDLIKNPESATGECKIIHFSINDADYFVSVRKLKSAKMCFGQAMVTMMSFGTQETVSLSGILQRLSEHKKSEIAESTTKVKRPPQRRPGNRSSLQQSKPSTCQGPVGQPDLLNLKRNHF